MEALREIHEVHSNSITVHLPNQFAKQVEVIILPVEDQLARATPEDPWAEVHQIREQLERS